MALVSDSLSVLKNTKGVRNILLFAGHVLIYSNSNPPHRGLVTHLRQVLPHLHQRYFQEMELLEAIEMHLASFRVMIYPKQRLSLVLLCETQFDSTVLQQTANNLLQHLFQNKELQRRIKDFNGS
jgi:hypothetical protein